MVQLQSCWSQRSTINVPWYDVISIWKDYDRITHTEAVSVYNDFIINNADKIDGVILSANWVSIKDKKQFLKDMYVTIAYLKKYNIQTILIGQNEIYSITYPVVKAKELQYNTKLTDRFLVKESYIINEFLKSNFTPYFVDIINKKTPGLSAENKPYMIDRIYFTRYGAELAVNETMADPVAIRFFKNAVPAKY
ncbi:MAG: hypothetical protein EOO43_16365 [Flavobacterium sp.]|nr:MAG: hypothetical protein EOO43_16365 [Flavobacterium sp.]